MRGFEKQEYGLKCVEFPPPPEKKPVTVINLAV